MSTGDTLRLKAFLSRSSNVQFQDFSRQGSHRLNHQGIRNTGCRRVVANDVRRQLNLELDDKAGLAARVRDSAGWLAELDDVSFGINAVAHLESLEIPFRVG